MPAAARASRGSRPGSNQRCEQLGMDGGTLQPSGDGFGADLEKDAFAAILDGRQP